MSPSVLQRYMDSEGGGLRTEMFGQLPTVDDRVQRIESVRRRSVVLAWISVGLFGVGLYLPLMGNVDGLTALLLGWMGPSFLSWSAAPLFFISVGALMFKRPGLVSATLAMLAFATTYWVMPGIDTGWSEESGEFSRVGTQIGLGFVVWSACVLVNFVRAVYHQIAEHRLSKLAQSSARHFSNDGFVDYPRASAARSSHPGHTRTRVGEEGIRD